jgi:hypothetical protein
MFEIDTAAEEKLLSVTGCGAGGEPIGTVPKLRLIGVTCRTGAGVALGVGVASAVGVTVGGPAMVGVGARIPVPVIETTWGLFTALSLMVTVSERGPGCCGAKLTLMAHEASGGSTAGH